MGFCTFCGKPLAEGEICTCQQPAAQTQFTYTAPQGTTEAQPKEAKISKKDVVAVKNSMTQDFKNIIDSPIEAGEKYFNTADRKKAITSIAVAGVVYWLTTFLHLVVSVLYALGSYKKTVKASYSFLISGMSYGDYLKADGVTRGDILKYCGINGGTWVQQVFFPIIYIVLMAAIMVGLCYLVHVLFVKGKFNFDNVIKLCGAVALPIAVACVVRFVGNSIHVYALRNILFTTAYVTCLGVVFLQAFSIIKNMITDRKKLGYAMCILMAGICLGSYLIGTLFLKHFDSYLLLVPSLI